MLYEKMEGGLIRCQACAHYCVISRDAGGICGVRQNTGHGLEVLVYGKPCVVNLDPVEKKPLYHFLPGTETFSLGTFGCNFGCGFCQNWDISQVSREREGWRSFLDDIDYLSPEEAIKMAIKAVAPSISFTYNEPTIWVEYALDICKLAKKADIKTVFVSNGYMSAEACGELVPRLDAINIDLKSFSEKFYNRTCKASLKPVLENIKRFKEGGVWTELTTLVIPGANDSENELSEIARFIASVDKETPWHLSAFHPDYKMTDTEPTGEEALKKARAIGKEAGLKYVYIGNIEAGEDADTVCPDCESLLVERHGMSAKITGLKDNTCKKCGHKIAGVF